MPEILVYIGAVVMVVLAVLAYRYWNSTGEFARRAREEQARLKHDALVAAAAAPTRPDDSVDTTADTTRDTAGDDIPVEVPIDTEVVEEVQSDAPGEIDDVEPPGQTDQTDQAAEEQPDEPHHAAEEEPDQDDTADEQPDQTDRDDTADEQPDQTDRDDTADAQPDQTDHDDTADAQPDETDEGEDATEGMVEPDQTDHDDTAEERPAGTSPVDVGEDDSAREELEDVEDEPVELVEEDRDRSPEAAEGEPTPDEEFQPDVAGSIAYRLIDELEPHSTGEPPADRKTVTTLLEDLNEQLAALPTGIELMELPTVERRRVADLRQALEKDRARLVEQRKKGAHRRRRRRRNSPNN